MSHHSLYFFFHTKKANYLNFILYTEDIQDQFNNIEGVVHKIVMLLCSTSIKIRSSVVGLILMLTAFKGKFHEIQ